MQILLIADPDIPVPPVHYGGIERIVEMLAAEYVQKGHEVTLLAGPGSFSQGRLVVFGKNGAKKSAGERAAEILSVWKYLAFKGTSCLG